MEYPANSFLFFSKKRLVLILLGSSPNQLAKACIIFKGKYRSSGNPYAFLLMTLILPACTYSGRCAPARIVQAGRMELKEDVKNGNKACTGIRIYYGIENTL